MIRIKRIYDAASPDDGQRVLVDRLWPRGVTKERAALDDWAKDVAPSTELRKWFGHDAVKMDAFATKYRAELESDPAKQKAVEGLLDRARKGTVTLLYGARDTVHNEAAVLADYLRERV